LNICCDQIAASHRSAKSSQAANSEYYQFAQSIEVYLPQRLTERTGNIIQLAKSLVIERYSAITAHNAVKAILSAGQVLPGVPINT
jgi:hypothetical protein